MITADPSATAPARTTGVVKLKFASLFQHPREQTSESGRELEQIRSQLGRKSLPLKQHLAVFERVFRRTCDPTFAGIALDAHPPNPPTLGILSLGQKTFVQSQISLSLGSPLEREL